MEDLPGNSINSNNEKPTEKKTESSKSTRPTVEPVISGKVVRRKKPLGKRFREMFIGGDAQNVGGYLVNEVFLPAVKETITEMVSRGIEGLLYGESGRERGRRSFGRSDRGFGRVRYDQVSTSSRRSYEDPRDRERRHERGSRGTYDFDDIILDDRDECEKVLRKMDDIIEEYDFASVADLLRLVDEDPTSTDLNWGWTNFSDARAKRVGPGAYMIIVPDPEHRDRRR